MRLFVTVLLVGICAGCGGESLKEGRVNVSGVVKLDDAPLSGASVTFVSGSEMGVGTTDASGKYSLVAGAATGNNKVVVSKTDPPETDPAKLAAAGATGGPAAPKEYLPAKYSALKSSELKFDVPSGGSTSADFNLSSK